MHRPLPRRHPQSSLSCPLPPTPACPPAQHPHPHCQHHRPHRVLFLCAGTGKSWRFGPRGGRPADARLPVRDLPPPPPPPTSTAASHCAATSPIPPPARPALPSAPPPSPPPVQRRPCRLSLVALHTSPLPCRLSLAASYLRATHALAVVVVVVSYIGVFKHHPLHIPLHTLSITHI